MARTIVGRVRSIGVGLLLMLTGLAVQTQSSEIRIADELLMDDCGDSAALHESASDLHDALNEQALDCAGAAVLDMTPEAASLTDAAFSEFMEQNNFRLVLNEERKRWNDANGNPLSAERLQIEFNNFLIAASRS